MKKVTLLLFFTTFLCLGQNRAISEKDSLTITKYKKLLVQHINPNPDSAFYYIKKIRLLSSQLNYGIGMVEANYFKASYYRRVQNSDSAIYYFREALQFSKKINYTKGIAMSYNGLCHIYYRQGNLNKAINECNNCLEVAKQINNLAILSDSYIALNNIKLRQNDLRQALKYVLKVDSIHNTQELRPDIIAAAYQSIGVIYLKLEQLNKSEEYFLKANNEFKKMAIDPSYYLYTTKWHLGEVYYKQGDLLRADSLLLNSYKFFNEIKDNRTVAEISKYLGLINIENNKYKEAGFFLLNAFNLHKEYKNEYEVSFVALELGKLYNTQNKPKKTIEILNQTIQYKTSKKNSFLKQEIYLALAKAYAKEKKYNNAYINLRNGIKLKDSLQDVQNVVQLSEIEEKYQSEKKRKEIVLLTSQKELTEHQKKNQLILLLVGIGLTTITGLFFFFLYRNKQNTSKKLQELDRAKSNFFANISHEFRTPLTLISGPIQKKLKEPNLPNEERLSLEMMQRNSNRLLSLVDQLLDISKIESGELHLSISENNLLNFIGILAESFTFSAKQKNINYLPYINKTNTDTWYDSDVIEKIVVNLLSNAIKYTPENGSIVCNAFVKNNQFHFEIKNTGKGLTYDDLNKIFDKFHQLNTHHEGVGIGLSLVKELVNLHKGTIDVKSTLNEWTLFKVILPIDRISFNKLEITKKEVEKKLPSLIINEPVPSILFDDTINKDTNYNLPILLIVDDNKDIRDYIDAIFNNNYTIIKAKNGQEGIKIALKQIPDIIISDIMMPVKNGIELCSHLKKDERTSHIPIILLTAKSGEKNEITGIKTGADDYITKPFSEDLLIVKIENIIKSRKKLQERYSQEFILMPKEITVNSVDEKFLTKIQKILDNNLVESSFTIEEFSKEIGMSRMQLHRKLKALTGLTTSEFIRSQRLKLAISLLKNSDNSVSEIGYSVGFNNHAYFSKCFKETYKCSPTEYLERKK